MLEITRKDQIESGKDIKSIPNIKKLGLLKNNLRQKLFKIMLPIIVLTQPISCSFDDEGKGLFASNIDAGNKNDANEDKETSDLDVNTSEVSDECFPTEEVCDGIDNDCNGLIDDNLEPPACEKELGVCGHPVKLPVCEGENGWTSCDYGQYFEEGKETKCDGLDNDCDGEIDEMEDLDGHQPKCDKDNVGVCELATEKRVCLNGEWTDCDYGPLHKEENSYDLCKDGLDNDCDGLTDCEDPDCNSICNTVTTLAVPPNVCYKQILFENQGNYTWVVPGTSNNDTKCTLDEISFEAKNGNILYIWVNYHNEIIIKTLIPVSDVQVFAGCSSYNYADPNAPSLNNLVNEAKHMTLDKNITFEKQGDEITLTHTSECINPTKNHVFAIMY